MLDLPMQRGAGHRLWVMMDGPAGAGKSTLAAALAGAFRAAGHRADLFGEEELFTRAEFSDVAQGFRTKEFARPVGFEKAYAAYLSGLGEDWAVFDWSAAGMAGDLDWALQDRARYVAHLRRVPQLDPTRSLILLILVVPARVATERAAAQRGRTWLNRYDHLAVTGGFRGPDEMERIIARAEYQLTPAAAERAAAAEAGWTIVELDAARPATVVAQQALEAIASRLQVARSAARDSR
ncbi:MAG TPA: hypothetical protein VHX59_02650 [Mycobacteriales bacterium]|jgi:thymidylate kinase|nr:hypothetical protein [Mycobacteriales bacterium]